VILGTEEGECIDTCPSFLLAAPRVSVGRSKGDITFPSNKAVSRTHGVFVLTPAAGGGVPGLSVVDTKSASGIFVDDKKIKPETEVGCFLLYYIYCLYFYMSAILLFTCESIAYAVRLLAHVSRLHVNVLFIAYFILLCTSHFTLYNPTTTPTTTTTDLLMQFPLHDGAVIIFGMVKSGPGSRVQVLLQRLRLCTTRLDTVDREQLKGDCSALCSLGVRCGLEEDAKKCSHLICNKFTVTAKILAAIVYRKPIVPSVWLRALGASVQAAQGQGEGVVRVLPLPLHTDSIHVPGMDTYRVVWRERDRGGILKGVLVVLFSPSNDTYYSVLTGCGAQVVRMYGSNSLGSGTGGTFPQLGEGTASQASGGRAGGGGGGGSQHMPPPSCAMSSMDGGTGMSYAEGASQASAGGQGAKSALNQRIRRHVREAAESRGSGGGAGAGGAGGGGGHIIGGGGSGGGSGGGGDGDTVVPLTCCIFLEKQSDVNKEVCYS
jgi:hypothetical protein